MDSQEGPPHEDPTHEEPPHEDPTNEEPPHEDPWTLLDPTCTHEEILRQIAWDEGLGISMLWERGFSKVFDGHPETTWYRVLAFLVSPIKWYLSPLPYIGVLFPSTPRQPSLDYELKVDSSHVKTAGEQHAIIMNVQQARFVWDQIPFVGFGF